MKNGKSKVPRIILVAIFGVLFVIIGLMVAIGLLRKFLPMYNNKGGTVDYRTTINSLNQKPSPAVKLSFSTTEDGVSSDFAIYISRKTFLDGLDDAYYSTSRLPNNWDAEFSQKQEVSVDALITDSVTKRRLLEYVLEEKLACIMISSRTYCEQKVVQYQDGFTCGPLCGSGTSGWETEDGTKLISSRWIS